MCSLENRSQRVDRRTTFKYQGNNVKDQEELLKVGQDDII